MIDLIEITVSEWRKTYFSWGEHDCLLSLADYLVDCGHDDFGVLFRGKYKTEKEAKKWIEIFSGEENLINQTGMKQTNKPVRGDICLVDLGETKIAGLCKGQEIIFRSEKGVLEINMRFLKILKSWKVN